MNEPAAAVPTGIDEFLNNVLVCYGYYDGPVLYTALDRFGRIHLVTLVDVQRVSGGTVETWHAVPLTIDEALDLVRGRVDMYDAIRGCAAGSVWSIQEGAIRAVWSRPVETVPDDLLPTPGCNL